MVPTSAELSADDHTSDMMKVSLQGLRRRRRLLYDTPPSLGPMAFAQLAAGLAGLAELRDWEPVGSMAETCRLAALGNGGLSDADIVRASRWPIIWKSVRPEVRAFYVKALSNETPLEPHLYKAVSYALRHVLDERPGDLPGWQYAKIEMSYRELYGHDSPHKLVPRATRK